jgi:hypothetical protein
MTDICFKDELRAVIIHIVVYYHLSHIINCDIFKLAVHPTCLDIYNIIFRVISFYVTI